MLQAFLLASHSPGKPWSARTCWDLHLEISILFASSSIYSTRFQVKNKCYLSPNSLSCIINFKILSIHLLTCTILVSFNFGRRRYYARVKSDWLSELAHSFTGHSPVCLDLKWKYSKPSLSGNGGNKNGNNKETKQNRNQNELKTKKEKEKKKTQNLASLAIVPKW